MSTIDKILEVKNAYTNTYGKEPNTLLVSKYVYDTLLDEVDKVCSLRMSTDIAHHSFTFAGMHIRVVPNGSIYVG